MGRHFTIIFVVLGVAAGVFFIGIASVYFRRSKVDDEERLRGIEQKRRRPVTATATRVQLPSPARTPEPRSSSLPVQQNVIMPQPGVKLVLNPPQSLSSRDPTRSYPDDPPGYAEH